MPVTFEQFVQGLSQGGLMTADEVAAFLRELPPEKRTENPRQLAGELVASGRITKYQARAVYQGKLQGLVVGDYLMLDELGAGGMGRVYKAKHRRMDRVVALKVLSAAAMTSPEAIRRFQREARAAARLAHPNIVLAFDAGDFQGTHYLVMEYVEGRNLSETIVKEGPLPVERAVHYILQAAEGLKYAHSQGVYHRDIKLSNLLVDNRGTVKILDMGLARFEGGDGTTSTERLTEAGQVMGSVDYMSPEQAAESSRADHRADIYSLGCSLYRLITGRAPYRASTVVNRLLAHRSDPIPSLCADCPAVTPQLDAVFRRMVAKTPEERQQSMGEVIAALRATVTAVDPASIHAEPPRPPSHRSDSFLAGKSSKSGFDAITVPPPAGDAGVVSVAIGGAAVESKVAENRVAENTVQTQSPTSTYSQSIIPASARAVLTPPPLPPRRTSRRTWLVVAAIVGLALVAAAVAYLSRGREPMPGGKEPTPAAPSRAVASPISTAPAARTLVPERRDADRRAAQLVLSLGGTVSGTAAGEAVAEISSKSKLPDEFLLHEANLDGSKKLTDDALATLSAIPTLERLFFERTAVTNAGLANLRSAHNLTALGLGGVAGISDAGLAPLAELKNLKALSLADTKTTDIGLVHLKGLTHLTYLNLAGTSVSDKGLDELKGLTNLTQLDLGKTKITEYGLGSLRNLKQLKTLGLAETFVGAQGLEWVKRNLPGCDVAR